jgi:hypothetical protein
MNNTHVKKMNKTNKHSKTNRKTRKTRKHKQKKTKKITRSNTKQNRKKKKKSKNTTLINGGSSCDCGSSNTISSFKNYMSNLRDSLKINNLGGSGYSVLPDTSIKGHKTIIKEYDDNNPPIIERAI